MKSLVIAEKPSVARDIARVLGANQKNQGVLEGSKYVVTWALGHLVTLAAPEEYDKKYPEYGFAKHKGYGTAAHIAAIKEHGLCPIHRRSFTKNFV